jgi:hypothetical protein
MKIILDREEVRNILITYLESLLPSAKFNKVEFDCGYSIMHKVTISLEEDEAE